MKPLLLSLLVLTVLSGTVASAETLRDLALEIFRALPSTIPAIKGNPPTPVKPIWARRCSSIRVSRPRACSAAKAATS